MYFKFPKNDAPHKIEAHSLEFSTKKTYLLRKYVLESAIFTLNFKMNILLLKKKQ